VSGKLASEAAGAWRPWSIWLPAALAFVWSGLLAVGDGYAAVMGSWDTPMPGLGWLGVGAAGQGVLAAVDVDSSMTRRAFARSAGRGQHALKLESLIPAGQSDFELPACEPCREALEDPGAAGDADGGNGGS
jgi:hypothetical protein